MLTTFTLTALFGSINFVVNINSEVGIFNQNNYNQIVEKNVHLNRAGEKNLQVYF